MERPATCNVTGKWELVGNWMASACLTSPPDAKPVVKIILADFWADAEAFKPVVEPMPAEQQHARGSPPVTPRSFHASPACSSSTSSGAPTSPSPGPMLSTSQIAAALSKLKSTAQAM